MQQTRQIITSLRFSTNLPSFLALPLYVIHMRFPGYGALKQSPGVSSNDNQFPIFLPQVSGNIPLGTCKSSDFSQGKNLLAYLSAIDSLQYCADIARSHAPLPCGPGRISYCCKPYGAILH